MDMKIQALLLCSVLMLSGCRNGNLFGGMHKRGDSGKVEYLLSDAAVALQAHDYTGALNLYERVLSQDPNNSQALYGASVAAIGASGLNFGQLVTNIVKQSNISASVSSVEGLADYIGRSRETLSASSVHTNPNSILNGIDFEALNARIDLAISRLGRIVQRRADGSIPSDDVNILVNLAMLHIIRAVSKPVEHDLIDIINTGGSYDVEADNMINGYCDGSTGASSMSGTETQTFVKRIMQDAVSCYVLLNRAAIKLNIGNDTDRLVYKLREDIESAIARLYDNPDLASFPDCLQLFDDAGGNALSTFDYDANNPL